ncbi:DUF167 domain-containing protein [Maritalea porphyrae]|jgi:uncharacterized protein (TIGR00251 family)|uniref:DUF167 domain-containing protein n=1 Tax=Maritalea porphyrae TaxID=880732 RepID=UPI0022B07687|nr:DUF167 family protein [Maritalea porphyrae]MCZ4272367.1 DUF167 family protein [Maritalea porphyrae]
MSNVQAWRQTDAGLEVFLRVTPNAHADQIGTIEGRDEGTANLVVRVRAIPDKGKANKAVVALFAKHFKLRKSDIAIIRGHQARQKTLLVREAAVADLIAKFDGL